MMRREKIPLLLFLLVFTLSVLLAAFRLDAGKAGHSFHHIPSLLLLKAGSYQHDKMRDLLLSNNEQFSLASNIQAGHTQGTWHSRDNFMATCPSMCSQQQVLQVLLKPGALEIWSTGSINVATNSQFDPHNYPLTITNGKPLFTGADLDPKSLSMGQDPITGYYFINFSMKNAAALKLTSFTSHNIGSYITITLQRMVISSLVLHYALPGKGQFQMSPRSLALLGIKCTQA